MIKFLTPNLALKEKIEASLNHTEHIQEKLKGGKRPVTWKCDIHKKCLITSRLAIEMAKLDNYIYCWGCLGAMLAAAMFEEGQ